MKIKESYPDKLPIICEPAAGSELRLDRTKFLIPNDFQAIQFQTLIRKRMHLGKETAITLFVNDNKILTSDSMMADVYERLT